MLYCDVTQHRKSSNVVKKYQPSVIASAAHANAAQFAIVTAIATLAFVATSAARGVYYLRVAINALNHLVSIPVIIILIALIIIMYPISDKACNPNKDENRQ